MFVVVFRRQAQLKKPKQIPMIYIYCQGHSAKIYFDSTHPVNKFDPSLKFMKHAFMMFGNCK